MVENEENQIAVLNNPKLPNNLSYITNTKDVYVNLFKITLKQNLTLYEYPFHPQGTCVTTIGVTSL